MKGITEILKNLRKIRSEMEGLELLIEDISKTTVTDVVSGSSCEFPYTARRFSITGVDMERLNEVTLKLVKKRSEYAAQLEQAAGRSILSYDLKLMYLCEECRNEAQKKGT